MQVGLLWIALILYGLGTLLLIPSVVNRRPTISSASLGALGLGLLAHASAIALEAAEIHRLPVTDVRSTLSFYAFLVTLTFFFLYLRYRITSLGLFMLPFVFVLTLISAVRPVRPFDLSAFRGGWLAVHIGSTILGYTGFIWASRTWKGPWEFDPKILASLLTWLIYLVLFSTRVSGGWRGRRAAYIAIFGFAAIMVTFLGVSLLSGPHGYVPTLRQGP